MEMRKGLYIVLSVVALYLVLPVNTVSAQATEALFAGGDVSIFKCLTSTDCNALGEWIAVTGYASGANDFAVDTVNGVIYAGTSNSGIILRCILSTDCDATAEWTTAYDTASTSIESILFDPINNVLYAGSGSGGDDGIIYRCATSSGCDTGATDWSAVLNTSGDIIQDIILDTTNNVLYANNALTFGGGSVVYRCPTSTGCDTSGEWTATFSGTAAGDNLYEMGYDATNSVLYAAGYDATGAELWRCNVATTSCDENGDWTKPRSVASTNFVSILIANGVLYVGRDFTDNIDRCLLTDGCDETGDFTTYSLPSTGTNVYALTYDPTASVLYAGTGSAGIIYRCLASSGCDAGTDWTAVADTTDGIILEIAWVQMSSPPNAITDLSCVASGVAGSTFLRFTTPTGATNPYTVKYSTTNITDDTTFNAATTLTQSWPVGTVGASQQQFVSGLSPGQSYFFNIKAASTLQSAISNTVYCLATVPVTTTQATDSSQGSVTPDTPETIPEGTSGSTPGSSVTLELQPTTLGQTNPSTIVTFSVPHLNPTTQTEIRENILVLQTYLVNFLQQLIKALQAQLSAQ